MGSGGRNNPRGVLDAKKFDAAKYWRNTLLIAIPLLIPPPPFTLLGIGWLVYRARKYMELRRKEASKVTSKVGARLMNIMLRNGKQLINVEALDEDDRFLKVVDAEGKELLIDRNYIAVVEPVQTELD
jgi:hypothetical protein